ncbi:hypothetical protein [Acinetobacter higginsii]|uniref:hypothetical protein n=1 Tax=Acinetobacter higginsii TaxID=70347 RepID=UPI002676B646|nr:hypothetical protein [Acinetobacter higginsii]MDO3663415.1 hypothetical protein [Acinetobacter higginsii]
MKYILWVTEETPKDDKTTIRINIDLEFNANYISQFDGGYVYVESNAQPLECESAKLVEPFKLRLKFKNSENYLDLIIPSYTDTDKTTGNKSTKEQSVHNGMKMSVYRSYVGFSYTAFVSIQEAKKDK